jgi:hypothetical protein
MKRIFSSFIRRAIVSAVALWIVCSISAPAQANVLYAQNFGLGEGTSNILKFAADGTSSVFASFDGYTPFINTLTSDNSGNLYVGVGLGQPVTVEKITADGTRSVFAINVALSGPLLPYGDRFTADNSGNFYVPQVNTIEKYSPQGINLGTFANINYANFPTLAFDNAGNLYATSENGNFPFAPRIMKFAPDGTGSVFAETGTDSPQALAVDGAGNLYAAMGGGTIKKFSATGADLGVFVSSNITVRDLAVDSDGTMYVTDGSTIEKFSVTGADLGVFATVGDGLHAFTGLTFINEAGAGGQPLALVPEPRSVWTLLALCIPVAFGIFRQRRVRA